MEGIYVYILRLEKGKYYVGKTENPMLRYKEHLDGVGSSWTKKYKTIQIIKLIPNYNNFDEDKYTKELMSKYHLCAYSTLNPQFIGMPGKTYSIKIKHQGKTYNASTKIENPVVLDSIYWKPENSLNDYGLIYANLNDPVDQQNNYYWETLRLKNDKYGNNVDMRFYKSRNPTFDDQFFNGLPFSFFYENPRSRFDETIPEEYRGYYQRGDTVLVKFSTIGRNEYTYYRKKHSQLNSAGSPFASPINIPSNISNNALGIWAGFSTTYQLLICR